MKKLFLLLVLSFIMVSHSNGQVMSPQLAGFSGINRIFYPYGFYQGGIIRGVANGDGMFYYANGVIFRGNFINGLPNGPGILLVPNRGYITGCWLNGQFAGQCQQTYNPYNNQNNISNTVDQAQNNQPNDNNNNYATVPKTNYKITQIDPDTQLGQSLLGRYSPANQ